MVLVNQYGTSTILGGIKAFKMFQTGNAHIYQRASVKKGCIPELNSRYRKYKQKHGLVSFKLVKLH